MTADAGRWATPVQVTDLDIAFGGRAMELMPPYADIPDQFKDWGNTWAEFQAEWFSNGLKSGEFKAQPGVSVDYALRHLKAIQQSWEPKHEHKQAGVAYLASLWFVSATANGKTFGAQDRVPR